MNVIFVLVTALYLFLLRVILCVTIKKDVKDTGCSMEKGEEEKIFGMKKKIDRQAHCMYEKAVHIC